MMKPLKDTQKQLNGSKMAVNNIIKIFISLTLLCFIHNNAFANVYEFNINFTFPRFKPPSEKEVEKNRAKAINKFNESNKIILRTQNEKIIDYYNNHP